MRLCRLSVSTRPPHNLGVPWSGRDSRPACGGGGRGCLRRPQGGRALGGWPLRGSVVFPSEIRSPSAAIGARGCLRSQVGDTPNPACDRILLVQLSPPGPLDLLYRHGHPRCLTRCVAVLPYRTKVDAAVDSSLGHPIGAKKLPADWVTASGPNARSSLTHRSNITVKYCR